MKLQIRFFANLYNFLIEDYPLQPNFLFKNSAEVNFILQNIHILDLPYCEPNRVEAIKDILKLYILKSDKLNINIPKFKYKIRYDKFLKQHVTEKILQPPIKELDTSYVLFRNYSPQELTILREKGNNLLFFNSKLCEVIKLLNFINQFFVVDHSKVSYCILDIASRFYDEEDLKIFLDSEIDIELNYIGIITNHECKNLDSFINSKQVAYNRFLILYHEAFKSFDKKELTILFKACSNNNNLVKSLILCPNSLTLEQCIKNIENYIELHQTLIKAPNYQKFLILYKNLFNNNLTLNQSDLLLNACNNKDLVKSLISDRIPFTFEERFNIVTKIINKYEHDLKLIPRLIIQLLNLLAYEKVKPSIKKMDIDSLIDSLAKYDNISINWCYPDGIPFESSKYCKLLGEDFYALKNIQMKK